MYKILIVEDTLVIREEVYDILSMEGYRVYQAENGKIGLEIAIKKQLDLIISDILMPELNGLEMFEKLKKNKKTANIPLIFLSAKGEKEDIRSGMIAGAEDYLVKPINTNELIKVVQNKLEKQQLVKNNIKKLVDENKFLLKEAGRMAKIGYWTYDKKTNTTRWSKVVHQIFGSDLTKGIPNLAIVVNCFELASKNKFKSANKKLVDKGVNYDLELQLTNLKNEKQWIQNIGEPLYNNKNEITGSRGIIRDITNLKNNEEELKESNERYKLIGLATNDAVWDWDLTNNKIYRNQEGFHKVFGFEKTTNLDEMKMDDYVHPTDRDSTVALLKKIIKDPDQNNFNIEYSFLSPNGNTLRILDKGFIVRDEKGIAIRIIGAASNITEQNNFKKSLENAYSSLKAVLESTADGILVVSNYGEVKNYNKKFLELWNIPDSLIKTMDDDVLLKYVLDQLVYPKKMVAKIKKLNEQKTISSDIIELKDGRVFKRYSKPKIINGVNTGRVWSFSDITERINAEKEKQQLFTLIESSQELISYGNLKGTPTFINKAGRKLLGISEKKSLSNYHFSDFFHPEYKEVVLERFKSNFKEKEKWEGDTYLMNLKTQKKNAVQMSTFIIKDSITGKPIGLGNVSIDIKARVKINNELIAAKEEAERLSGFKDQFLANMSHEIRTPLNGIIGFTKILLRSNITKKQKEQLTTIKVSSDILLVVINDILDLAKIEAGKMVLEKTELKVTHLINSIISTFELRLKEKKQKLQTSYDKNIPEWVLGDPVRINQILLNLIENAIKFTDVGGVINLHVNLLKQNSDSVIIEIKITDTGIGIPANKIENIFAPFTQTDSSTSRKYGGSGLGLNIVKQLIDLMKGTISVSSKLHIGTAFTLTIPLIKTTTKEIKENQILSIDNKVEYLDRLEALGHLKILIVDDMVINQLLAKTILEDIGFETEVAANGKIAIELLEKNIYDIILMDLQMPEMNGWEATEYIRNKMEPPKSTIPIIALTADVTQKNADKCIESGMDEYVSKPINEKDLLHKVTHLVIEKRKQVNNTQPKPAKVSNLDTLKSSLRNKPKLIAEMLQLILNETPLVISQINKCLITADWSSLHGNVHKIKPTLDLMGLPKDILLAVKQIEEHATTQDNLDLIPNKLIKLEKALSTAYKELEEELQIMKN